MLTQTAVSSAYCATCVFLDNALGRSCIIMFLDNALGRSCIIMFLDNALGRSCIIMFLDNALRRSCIIMFLDNALGRSCIIMFLDNALGRSCIIMLNKIGAIIESCGIPISFYFILFYVIVFMSLCQWVHSGACSFCRFSMKWL